jgi:[ribosomal protein S5]-alanine N-acetyltransferase
VLRLPIESERLLLRAFRPDADLDDMMPVYADAEVMRYIPGGVLPDAAAVHAELAKHAADQERQGYSFLAVVERASGRVVGDAGFGIFEPTGDLELGYTFARSVWGRGYATEAAGVCLEAAWAGLDAERIVAVIDERNPASVHVVEKLGMRLERRMQAYGLPHLIYVAWRA